MVGFCPELNLGIGIGRVPKVTLEATRRAEEEEEDCGDGSCDATVLLEKPNPEKHRLRSSNRGIVYLGRG